MTRPVPRPRDDELELSLFGPGFGECVLLHLGRGSWMIVDSCRDARTGRQPALERLRAMDLDPSCVDLVVGTHWHLDHVRGLAEVVAACTEARVVLSAAMATEELLGVVGLMTQQPPSSRNVYRELRQVVDVLLARAEGLYGVPPVATAKAGSLLLPLDRPTVLALSPSDVEVGLSLRSFATQLLPDVEAVPAPTPNHAAVALWVQTGQLGVLLGSDLEMSSAQDRGWNSALRALGQPTVPGLCFKVPHHGSTNAHCERVWTAVLCPRPVAVLTPFKRGNVLLPTSEDLKRLRSSAGQVYITASPRSQGPYRPNDRLTSVMRRYVRNLREAEGVTGRVTLRAPLSGCAPEDVTMDLEAPATAA